MNLIELYRNGGFLTSIKPDDSSLQRREVMGENQLTISFEVNEYIHFMINDYCTVFGHFYFMQELPVVTKGSKYNFKYTLVMKGQEFLLNNYQYLFYDGLNELRESDFSVMGDANTFIDLLILNANRVGSGWEKGEVQPTAYKNITFSKETCYNALVRIAEEFETEFSFEGKKIHLIKKQVDTGRVFEVGKNKGLYEIIRNNINSGAIITRLYVYGSEKNLPPEYTSNRLRLPGEGSACLVHNLMASLLDNGDGTTTYTFTFTHASGEGISGLTIESRTTGSSDPWDSDTGSSLGPRNVTYNNGSREFRFKTISSGICNNETSSVVVIAASTVTPLFSNNPIPHLEQNTAVYGVIEHTEIFDDIFPSRTGVISSVNVSNVYKFIDTSIDFDINQYLLPGMTPKVVFNKGQLAGYEFEVSSFNNSTKELTILKNKDERVLELPSVSLKPAIGDEYILIDLRLPQRYIYLAEQKLLAKAQVLLEKNSTPQVSYQVKLDPVYIKTKSINPNPNDLVWIVDEQMRVERKIRIKTVTRNIVKENEYEIELNDIVESSTLGRVVNSINSNGRAVADVNQQLTNKSILNNNVIGDLRVKQGTIVIENIPETSSLIGFLPLYLETATGKIFRKV